jgi:hypothetical protein
MRSFTSFSQAVDHDDEEDWEDDKRRLKTDGPGRDYFSAFFPVMCTSSA